MRRERVTSSNIAEIGYDEPSRTLEVMFNNGRIYQYFEVPQQVYRELVGGGSIGKYLNAHIKGTYRYARV